MRWSAVPGLLARSNTNETPLRYRSSHTKRISVLSSLSPSCLGLFRDESLHYLPGLDFGLSCWSRLVYYSLVVSRSSHGACWTSLSQSNRKPGTLGVDFHTWAATLGVHRSLMIRCGGGDAYNRVHVRGAGVGFRDSSAHHSLNMGEPIV